MSTLHVLVVLALRTALGRGVSLRNGDVCLVSGWCDVRYGTWVVDCHTVQQSVVDSRDMWREVLRLQLRLEKT